jgi:hypothetical protein
MVEGNSRGWDGFRSVKGCFHGRCPDERRGIPAGISKMAKNMGHPKKESAIKVVQAQKH